MAQIVEIAYRAILKQHSDRLPHWYSHLIETSRVYAAVGWSRCTLDEQGAMYLPRKELAWSDALLRARVMCEEVAHIRRPSGEQICSTFLSQMQAVRSSLYLRLPSSSGA